MDLIEITQALSANLLVYRGEEKGYIKQKNEIAKKLLLTTLRAHRLIQTDSHLASKGGVVLYAMLIDAYQALLKLKDN